MIALFDMDGTLFPGDSQLRFAGYILSRHPLRRLYLLLVLPIAILTALHMCRPSFMKRAFLSYLWHMKRTDIEHEAASFVSQELLPALYPEVRRRLRLHQSNGDTCILVSASPDFYTDVFGRVMGFSAVCSTPFEWHERMPLLPKITPPGNNKGRNKVLRLQDLNLIPDARPLPDSVCYTDSRADLPMLSLCERGVLINPTSKFAKNVPVNVEILTPSQPWKSTGGKLYFLLRKTCGF